MTRSRMSLALAACLALAVALGGCGKSSTPITPGSGPLPYLGLVPNPSDPAFFHPDSAREAVELPRSTGVNMVQMGDLWRTLEPSAGALSGATLRLQCFIYTTLGVRPFFNLRLIDTNQRGVPADLASTAWDAPAMTARVDAVVDTILAVSQLYPLIVLGIGNEVDVYFAAHPSELPAFRALLTRQIARIHAAQPGLPVGTSTTSPQNGNGWVGDTLNAYTDVRMYTYYPFVPASDFQMQPPSVLDADLDAMLARGTSPMFMQEVGYSSSPACGSSPALQSEFARRFRQWHARQTRSRVLGVSYFMYTDWSSATLNTLYTYYGLVSPGFAGYLGGLGLRDSSGIAKPAWEAWKNPS